MFLIRYFDGTLSNSMCITTTEMKLFRLVVLEFLIQNRWFICVYTYTHTMTNQSKHLYLSMQSDLSSYSAVHEHCIRGAGSTFLASKDFKKRKTVTAFQPSITTRQNLPLLYRNWVIMPCAGGAWEVKSRVSEWGCRARHTPTPTPTPQLLPLCLSIDPTSEGDKLSSKVSWFSCTKV